MSAARKSAAPLALPEVEPAGRCWDIEKTARNVVTIRLHGASAGWEQSLLLRSDVHHDHPQCDWKLEKKHLDEARDRGAIIIDNGDLFCAMQGKYDKRASKDNVREEHQYGDYLDRLVETAAEFYAPYAANFAVLGRGNHETSIRKRHETDLTERLASELRKRGSRVQTSGYGGWVRFIISACGRPMQTILLHHYHGAGGGGPVTRGVIMTNRMAVYTPDADIILTGHTHDEWVVTIARQRFSEKAVVYRDEVKHVRVPGYKDAWDDGSCGWENETGKGPKPLGAAWCRFYYEAGEDTRRVKYEITEAK